MKPDSVTEERKPHSKSHQNLWKQSVTQQYELVFNSYILKRTAFFYETVIYCHLFHVSVVRCI